jgi:two-component system sensor histidine kinase RpfC
MAHRPELEQTSLRVVIAGIVMVYLFWYAFRDGAVSQNEQMVLFVSVLFFAFGLVLMLRVLLTARPSVGRRYLGMVADNAVTSFCLMQMGEGGAVVIGVYLFITFGNGFRYGRRYLHACQALGVAGFTAVLVLSDFWSHHVAIGTGFLIGLVILPFYVGVLAERIENAKKRADEANQAKGRFVANVSHEMRTPLNGVIAMADILRETSLSEAQREVVETMTTSAQLLLAQIEDVLDLSKIEAGRILIESRPFNLARLLSSAVKVVLPQARYKGLEVGSDIALTDNEWFAGDAHHLHQVILNLLSNAVKFTNSGKVTLAAAIVESIDEERLVRIEVRDTGIGIAPAKQEAIFEPFAQADDSVTRIYGGTGLGTTIARQLVGLMGGTIGLTSDLGKGSVFWIELRLKRSAPQGVDLTNDLSASPKSAATAQALAAVQSTKIHRIRGARILVAEDNPTNQRVAQLILESGSHVVTIVENGEAALNALESGPYDLALFDLSMPVISGLQALKLYRFTTAKPIPVLILSANVTPETIAECERAGAAEFIPKPLRASYVLDAIERHLASEATATTRQVVRREEKPQFAVVDTPAIDVAVLHDLDKLSPDPTFVKRLIDGFESDTNRLVGEISSALTARKYEAVRDAAHALKGGAASVGATQLTQLARRLEQSAPESLRIKSAQFIEELLKTSNFTLELLKRHLSGTLEQNDSSTTQNR